MNFHNSTADIFIPDGAPVDTAFRRITHLGIGAHQDDLEFMAFHGILACYQNDAQWFGGVTCTNGSGSARTGPYAQCSDAGMMAVRRREQNAAATLGQYSVMIQLDHASSHVKNPTDTSLRKDLKTILSAARPQFVYTHNLADKHDTHLAVAIAALQAMRELPPDQRPPTVWGCEVWRGLDWLPDAEKVPMDVSGRPHLAAALNGLFDSQIAGGKRYDLATTGRRAANATFFESHATDEANQLIFGMNLSPLVQDESRDIMDYVCDSIERFKLEVLNKLAKRLAVG
jgi:LmbE family N-acetylglucosaminyl deacetylase